MSLVRAGLTHNNGAVTPPLTLVNSGSHKEGSGSPSLSSGSLPRLLSGPPLTLEEMENFERSFRESMSGVTLTKGHLANAVQECTQRMESEFRHVRAMIVRSHRELHKSTSADGLDDSDSSNTTSPHLFGGTSGSPLTNSAGSAIAMLALAREAPSSLMGFGSSLPPPAQQSFPVFNSSDWVAKEQYDLDGIEQEYEVDEENQEHGQEQEQVQVHVQQQEFPKLSTIAGGLVAGWNAVQMFKEDVLLYMINAYEQASLEHQRALNDNITARYNNTTTTSEEKPANMLMSDQLRKLAAALVESETERQHQLQSCKRWKRRHQRAIRHEEKQARRTARQERRRRRQQRREAAERSSIIVQSPPPPQQPSTLSVGLNLSRAPSTRSANTSIVLTPRVEIGDISVHALSELDESHSSSDNGDIDGQDSDEVSIGTTRTLSSQDLNSLRKSKPAFAKGLTSPAFPIDIITPTPYVPLHFSPSAASIVLSPPPQAPAATPEASPPSPSEPTTPAENGSPSSSSSSSSDSQRTPPKRSPIDFDLSSPTQFSPIAPPDRPTSPLGEAEIDALLDGFLGNQDHIDEEIEKLRLAVSAVSACALLDPDLASPTRPV